MTNIKFGIAVLILTIISRISGENRELIPLEAPGNLTLLEIKGRQVLIEWDPVDPQSVRGNFKGYLVRTWNHLGSQVYAFPPDITKASVEFFPFSKNFITVSVRNEKFVGPPSEAISFDAPQIEPKSPTFLKIYPLSNTSVFLKWDKPAEANGILLGYKIYCYEVNDALPEERLNQVTHQINDPDKLQAKLTGMEKGQKYRIGISTLNCAGESNKQSAEIVLEDHISEEPFPSKFIYKINYKTKNKDEECYKSSTNDEEDNQETPDYDYFDYLTSNSTQDKKQSNKKDPEESQTNCLVDCLVLWLPDLDNNPGEYFYLKYRLKGEEDFKMTPPELSEDFILLRNFDACKNYEFVLTTTDGDYKTDSSLVVTPTKTF